MSTISERFKRLYSGVVYDAAYYDIGHRERFVIERGIRFLAGHKDELPMVGPAFTCWGTRPTVYGEDAGHEEADRIRLDIFEAVKPGDVVMMDTDQDTTVAHFGDITAAILSSQRGAAGVVIDGYTRDVGRFHLPPLFARGAQPQDAYGKWSLQKHSEPILFTTTGGNRITVNPGDLIFGDLDGAMVIPAGIAEAVADAAEARLASENAIRRSLEIGLTPREVYERCGRW